MGCGSSRESDEVVGIAKPLESEMEILNIEKLDKIFEGASQIIEKVESLRSLIVDDKDELIISSGACSYLEPKLNDTFYGICWKLSADNKGNFLDSGLDFDVENKCLTVTGDKSSEEAKKAFDQFNKFIKGFVDKPGEMKELQETVTELGKQITENPQEIIDEIKNNISDPLESIKTVKNAYSNIDKVKKLIVIVPDLSKELAESCQFLLEIPKILSDKEKLKKIDEVGKKAFQTKRTDSNLITWDNITDPKNKFGKKPEDGVIKWENKRKLIQDMKNKKKKNK